MEETTHHTHEIAHHEDKPKVSESSAVPTTVLSTLTNNASLSTPEQTTYISSAKPIGTLDVSLTTVDKDDASSHDVDQLKLLSKAGGIKKSTLGGKKIGLGAKRLSSNSSADTKMESFESIEKRNERLQQDLQNMNISETNQAGRVAAFLREDDQAQSSSGSIYRNSTVSSKNTSVLNANVHSSNESFVAREKYSNVKSISSDQFFGLEDEGNQVARTKLQTQYGKSNAISSDMLYGSDNSEGNDDFHGGTAAEGISLDKLKDSVSGFFENIQRRIG